MTRRWACNEYCAKARPGQTAHSKRVTPDFREREPTCIVCKEPMCIYNKQDKSTLALCAPCASAPTTFCLPGVCVGSAGSLAQRTHLVTSWAAEAPPPAALCRPWLRVALAETSAGRVGGGARGAMPAACPAALSLPGLRLHPAKSRARWWRRGWWGRGWRRFGRRDETFGAGAAPIPSADHLPCVALSLAVGLA